MRNIPQLLATAILLVSQVTNSFAIAVTAQSSVTTLPAGNNQTKIVLNLASPDALSTTYIKPNIETEMLTPIHEYQAEQARLAAEAAAKAAAAAAAAKAAAIAKAKLAPKPAAAPFTGQSIGQAQIQFLGLCESGMTWNRNSGNGFYGAFQFTIGTWNAMQTGYARADMAPLDVQVSAVQKLLSHSSIYSQFPGCARQMAAKGLI